MMLASKIGDSNKVFSAQMSSSQATRHPTLQQAISMLETVFRSCSGISVRISTFSFAF